MNEQQIESQRVVQEFTQQADRYWQQLHLWLGIGSAGAVLSLTGVIAGISEPKSIDNAIIFFAPSYLMFLFGIVSAGIAVLSAAKHAASGSNHFASAGNRAALGDAIRAMPQVFSAPASIAEEQNKPRNELIKKHDQEHARAEAAWSQRLLWLKIWAASLIASAIAFICGFVWPLYAICWLGKSFVSP